MEIVEKQLRIEFELLKDSDSLMDDSMYMDLTNFPVLLKKLHLKLNQHARNKAYDVLDNDNDMRIYFKNFIVWYLDYMEEERKRKENPNIYNADGLSDMVENRWETVVDYEMHTKYYKNGGNDEVLNHLNGTVNGIYEQLQKMLALKKYQKSSIDQRLRAMFKKFDLDRNETLDSDECRDLLSAIGIRNRSSKESEWIVQQISQFGERNIDKNNPVLSIETFVSYFEKHYPIIHVVQYPKDSNMKDWERRRTYSFFENDNCTIIYRNKLDSKIELKLHPHWILAFHDALKASYVSARDTRMKHTQEEHMTILCERWFLNKSVLAAPSKVGNTRSLTDLDAMLKALIDAQELTANFDLAQPELALAKDDITAIVSCLKENVPNAMRVTCEHFIAWYTHERTEYLLQHNNTWRRMNSTLPSGEEQTYYFNLRTQESSWELPENFMQDDRAEILKQDEENIEYDPETMQAYAIWQVCYEHSRTAAVDGTIDVNELGRIAKALEYPLRGNALLSAIKVLEPQGLHTIQVESLIDWWTGYKRECIAKLHFERRRQVELEVHDKWIEMEEKHQDGVAFYYVNARNGKKQWEDPVLPDRMTEMIKRIRLMNPGTSKMEQIEMIFQDYDQSKTNSLYPAEFRVLLFALGLPLSSPQLAYAMEAMTKRRRVHAEAESAIEGRPIIRFDYNIKFEDFFQWWISFERRPMSKSNKRLHILQNQRNQSRSTSRSSASRRSAKSSRLNSALPQTNALVGLPNEFDIFPDEERIYAVDEYIPYGKFGMIKYSPTLIQIMTQLLDDVVMITPLCMVDAAIRFQRFYRNRRNRLVLLNALSNRYIKKVDFLTKQEYYINRLTNQTFWQIPMAPPELELLTPRSQLKKTHEKDAKVVLRRWLALNDVANTINSQPYRTLYRSAAFYTHSILLQVTDRIRGAIWSAIEKKEYVLSQLIIRRDPKQLDRRGPNENLVSHVSVINHFPVMFVQRMVENRPTCQLQCDSYSHTPLHLAARDRTINIEVVDALLSTEIGQSACSLYTNIGDLPLHVALIHKISPACILRIAKCTSTKALATTNRRGNTPLHAAVLYFQTMKVVRLIASKCPAAMGIKNSYGDFPLHAGLRSTSIPNNALTYFINNYPEYFLRRNAKNLLPVHYVLKHSKSYGTDNLRMILNIMKRSGFTVQQYMTSQGYPIAHYAVLCNVSLLHINVILLEMESDFSYPGKHTLELPLHLACRICKDLEVVQRITEVYPDALEIRNVKDQLPLHVAIISQNMPVVQYLTQICPWTVASFQSFVKSSTMARHRVKANAAMLSCNINNANIQIVDDLMAKTQSVNENDESLISPYFIAINGRNNPTVVKSLLAHEMVATDREEHDLSLEKFYDRRARAVLRRKGMVPSIHWNFGKLIKLLDLNPTNTGVHVRVLMVWNRKLMKVTVDDELQCIMKEYDLVRIVNRVMYEYSDHLRIQILGRNCVQHLLPTAFAVQWYQCHIDPYFQKI